jgi:hypothetical protein
MHVLLSFDSPQKDARGVVYQSINEHYDVSCAARQVSASHLGFMADVRPAPAVLSEVEDTPLDDYLPVSWDDPVWTIDHSVLMRAAQSFCNADKPFNDLASMMRKKS